MSRRLVLCGDIGGTKTLLAVAALDGDRLEVVFERRYADRDFAEFTDLVSAFRDEARTRVERACLGIAGPIDGRRVAVTNFPWRIDADSLEALLGVPVALANDFVAAAHGIDVLRPEDVATLQAGDPEPRAPQLVISARRRPRRRLPRVAGRPLCGDRRRGRACRVRTGGRTAGGAVAGAS